MLIIEIEYLVCWPYHGAIPVMPSLTHCGLVAEYFACGLAQLWQALIWTSIVVMKKIKWNASRYIFYGNTSIIDSRKYIQKLDFQIAFTFNRDHWVKLHCDMYWNSTYKAYITDDELESFMYRVWNVSGESVQYSGRSRYSMFDNNTVYCLFSICGCSRS